MRIRGTKHGGKTNIVKQGVLCLGIFLSTAHGAENAATNLTLKAALAYAETDHPQIGAAFQLWKGAEESIAVQKALPDPMLTYGFYVEPIETRVGPQNQRFGLTQKIPAFGKLEAKQNVAEANAVAVQHQYEEKRLQLRTAIVKAYAELYYLEQSIRITQDRIRLINDLEEVARTRYTAGATLNATLQAQLELGRLENQLNSLIDRRGPRVSALNALLNRPLETPISLAPTLPDTSQSAPALTATANPELQALEARIQQRTHQLDLAQKERRPDITLGLTYIETGSAVMPTADSGQDAIIASIGLSLPIWKDKNSARIRAAAHQKSAAQLMLADRSQRLQSEIDQQLFDLRDAERKINLYKESLIPKAQQALAVNRQGYETGKLEFINLIDTERTLLEFELAYERALVDQLIAHAELSRLSGTDLIAGETHETH